MIQVHEFSTWMMADGWDSINRKAIESGKSATGSKFVVSIGQWGTRTFLVLGADSKETARQAAINYCKNIPGFTAQGEKTTVRDVTNSKKYN